MKIGFIGCGHMGGALAQAIGSTRKHEIYLADHCASRAQELADALSGRVSDALKIAGQCRFVFLGVRPCDLPALLEQLRPALAKNPGAVAVCMAAGVTVRTLSEQLGGSNPVIRILPNMPVALGEGMTVYTPGERVSAAMLEDFCALMKPTGRVEPIDEALMDAACVVSGCGSAYAYLFADALAKAGQGAGLSGEAAKLYAAQMLRGAATVLLQSEKSAETLCKEVCSVGGSTIEGVKVLQAQGLDKTVQAAFEASLKRTAELGQMK